MPQSCPPIGYYNLHAVVVSSVHSRILRFHALEMSNSVVADAAALRSRDVIN